MAVSGEMGMPLDKLDHSRFLKIYSSQNSCGKGIVVLQRQPFGSVKSYEEKNHGI